LFPWTVRRSDQLPNLPHLPDRDVSRGREQIQLAAVSREILEKFGNQGAELSIVTVCANRA
jgi:hypothetical protein